RWRRCCRVCGRCQILRRGKPHRPTEFGRLVEVHETEGGIVTAVGVVDSKADAPLLVPAVEQHSVVFGRAPGLVATDTGGRAKLQSNRSEGGGRGADARLVSVSLPLTPRIKRALGRTESRTVTVQLHLTKLGQRLFAKLGGMPGGLAMQVQIV